MSGGRKYTNMYIRYLREFLREITVHADDVGVMDEIMCDNAAEQTGPGSEFMKTVRHLKIKLRATEPHTPRQNDAERKIGEVKKRWRHRMITKAVPRRLTKRRCWSTTTRSTVEVGKVV